MTFKSLEEVDSTEYQLSYRNKHKMEDESTTSIDEGGLGCMDPELYLYTTESTRNGSSGSQRSTCSSDPKLHYDRAESIENDNQNTIRTWTPMMRNETETSSQGMHLPVIYSHTPTTPGDQATLNWQGRGCAFDSQYSVGSNASDVEDTLTHLQSEPYPSYNTLMGRRCVSNPIESTLTASYPHGAHPFERENRNNSTTHLSGSEMALIGDISNLTLVTEQPSSVPSKCGLAMDLSKLNISADSPVKDNTIVTRDYSTWTTDVETENFYVGHRANSGHMDNVLPGISAPAASCIRLVDNKISEPIYPNISPEMTIQQDFDGDTMLHNAIIQEMFDFVLVILSRIPGYYVLNLVNNLKQTPLHIAVIIRQPRIIRALITHGAYVDMRDGNGDTALHMACKRGFLNCVKELTRPLHESELAKCRYQVPFQRLPQNCSIVNYAGESCIHLAADSGNIDILSYLLKPDIGHNVNVAHGCTGRTILHEALSRNNLKLITYLLTNSVLLKLDVNCKTFDGVTPMQLATDNEGIMEALKSFGAADDVYMMS